MNNDCGIYSITNMVDGKRYVGSAHSFTRRWRVHTSQLRRGAHPNRKLQAAWNKYGEESFEFEKIALCPITDLLAAEQIRIDRLKPEYNLTPTAGSQLGFKFTREAIERAVSARRGKYTGKNSPNWGRKASAETRAKQSALRKRFSGAAHPRAKQVICVETGHMFPTATSAALWVKQTKNPKAHVRCISLACQNKIRTAYGYTWHFATDPDKAAIQPDYLKGANSPFSKKVICIETGAIFGALADAERWLKVNGFPKAGNNAISRACQGKQKVAYGYHWKYAEAA
jgi:group I intron endonuclease